MKVWMKVRLEKVREKGKEREPESRKLKSKGENKVCCHLTTTREGDGTKK